LPLAFAHVDRRTIPISRAAEGSALLRRFRCVPAKRGRDPGRRSLESTGEGVRATALKLMTEPGGADGCDHGPGRVEDRKTQSRDPERGIFQERA
jgi:hypothetical protein